MRTHLILVGVLVSTIALAQDTLDVERSTLFDMSLEELLKMDVVDKKFYLYGYVNANVQKTFDVPSYGPGETTERTSEPLEWTPIRNFHLYGQGNLSSKISYLFNLARNGDLIEIRNAWGNFALRDIIQIRVGKMYRKFGLYNEKLDQIPTFIGIEPPEMFDTDHLFLTRTTSFMIHGQKDSPRARVSYALMTDNGEAGPSPNLIPIGWDFRVKSYKSSMIIGTSGYASSINKTRAGSTVALGSGPPNGGILPWMSGDKYTVMGVFIEKELGNLLIQSEYYNAKHTAERDPSLVLQVINNANINDTQRERFLGANASKPDNTLTTDDVIVNTSYNVQTWYVRLGYNLQSNIGQFVPYLFLDWMEHPEVIQNKKYGGDDEAGLSENGKFFKPSAGVVYRPIPAVAIKLDGSYHQQLFNGETTIYPEVRLDFSFAFSNQQFSKALGN